MSQITDLVGKVFFRWVVIGGPHIKKSHYYWDCKCSCGTERQVQGHTLRLGLSKSCGCLRDDISKTHGLRYSKIYNVWNSIIARCKRIKHKSYNIYGGRGITYDKKWEKFEGFFEDMGDGYAEGLSIDRIDNNGNYCKENCRWTTKYFQDRNKRTNRYLCHNGKRMILADWAMELGISPSSLIERINKWGETKALSFKKIK